MIFTRGKIIFISWIIAISSIPTLSIYSDLLYTHSTLSNTLQITKNHLIQQIANLSSLQHSTTFSTNSTSLKSRFNNKH